MTLDTPEQIEQTWGGHQPVLKAVLEVIRPRSAVECGCGMFSTPYLQTVPALHTIEHDPRWAAKFCRLYSPPPHHQWTIHLFNAKNSTCIRELPPGEYQTICKWYTSLAARQPPFDFLFVDTLLSCRVPAAETLGCKAQLILIHDLEPPGPEVYEWPRLRTFLKDWCHYIHRPMGRVNKVHQIPWTGLYSREPLNLDALNDVVRRESKELWGLDVGLGMLPQGEDGLDG